MVLRSLYFLFSLIILLIPLIQPSDVFARDPYPNKQRTKYIVAPRQVESDSVYPTDPQTMIKTNGERSDIISFACYFGGHQSRYKYLNQPEVNTMEKARAICDADTEYRNYQDDKKVLKPYLKNNKGVVSGEEKFDVDGYDWPIGNFLGRHPKAGKGGGEWVTPMVYAARGGPLNACGSANNQLCDCIYVPFGPRETWIKIHSGQRECVSPPYSTSGPWWNWFVGEMTRIRNGINIDNLTAAMVLFGIDGEGRPFKSGEGWGPDPGFAAYVSAVIEKVKELYPGKVIRAHFTRNLNFFLTNEIDFHWESLSSDGSAEYLYRGLYPGYDQIYADYFYITNTLGLNPDWPPYYQSLLNALIKHTDGITGFVDIYQSIYEEGRGDFIKFAGSYIGRDINDTPGVWINLRETMHKKGDDSNTSGKYGDYMFYLYRTEELSGNKTVPVRTDELPSGTSLQIYNYRLPLVRHGYPTDNQFVGRKSAPGNRYMSFDVDDGYRFTGKVSSYDVRIVYLDVGTDSFAFQYKDSGNNWRERSITKTNTRLWQEARFAIDGAFLNNNASEGTNADLYPTDFRLDLGGAETVIHLIELRGKGEEVVPQRPKAQVSCDIVKDEGDDPKDGVYSIGLNQDFKVKATLVGQDGRPITGERVMFTYNTEWNFARSSVTNEQGLAFGSFNTSNRQDSSGFVSSACWNATKLTLYSVQVYYAGSSTYQPSRNDCFLPIACYTGVSNPKSAKMKILDVDSSRVASDGKVKVKYQILNSSGVTVATEERWMGKAEGFYANDPNYQTLFLSWVGGDYHAAFNNVTVRGLGTFPSVSPRPPTPTLAPSVVPTVTPSGTVLSPTPTPYSSVISLTEGWNRVVWQANYPTDREFSDVPDACPVVELSDGGFWRVYVKSYGGENLRFERGKDYSLKCESAYLWRL